MSVERPVWVMWAVAVWMAVATVVMSVVFAVGGVRGVVAAVPPPLRDVAVMASRFDAFDLSVPGLDGVESLALRAHSWRA